MKNRVGGNRFIVMKCLTSQMKPVYPYGFLQTPAAAFIPITPLLIEQVLVTIILGLKNLLNCCIEIPLNKAHYLALSYYAVDVLEGYWLQVRQSPKTNSWQLLTLSAVMVCSSACIVG